MRNLISRLFNRLPGIPAVCLLYLCTGGYLAASDPVLYSDDYANPGEILQVIISGNPMDDISVSLQDSRERTLSRSEGFVWRTPTGRAVSVALIGIPSTAAPGRYQLILNAEEGRAEWQLEKTLIINEVFYPEQVISLSDKMNDLYADESERKKSEARELWAVLTSFNKSAIYNPGTLGAPLATSTPTAGFGERRRFRMPDGTESSSIHFGKDLWAETGTPVYASGRGRIVLSAERYLTGNTVVIEHLPGVFSVYYHMDSVEAGIGEMVRQGDKIGTVGETGFATGEHLHWELRVGATPVDPEQFLVIPLLDTNALMSKM